MEPPAIWFNPIYQFRFFKTLYGPKNCRVLWVEIGGTVLSLRYLPAPCCQRGRLLRAISWILTVHVAHISAALTAASREGDSSVNGCYFPAPFETLWSLMKIASKRKSRILCIYWDPLEENVKMKNAMQKNELWLKRYISKVNNGSY